MHLSCFFKAVGIVINEIICNGHPCLNTPMTELVWFRLSGRKDGRTGGRVVPHGGVQ